MDESFAQVKGQIDFVSKDVKSHLYFINIGMQVVTLNLMEKNSRNLNSERVDWEIKIKKKLI